MNITTFEIEKVLPIKRSNLQQWIEKGFICPSIERASGVGTKNLFSEDDIFSIILLLSLVKAGFELRTAGIYLKKRMDEVKKSAEEIQSNRKVRNIILGFISDSTQNSSDVTTIDIVAGNEIVTPGSFMDKFDDKQSLYTNYNLIDVLAIKQKTDLVVEEIKKIKMK